MQVVSMSDIAINVRQLVEIDEEKMSKVHEMLQRDKEVILNDDKRAGAEDEMAQEIEEL